MSLIAYREGSSSEEIESFAIEPAIWNAMRREPLGTFRMFGSDWPAVLKRSQRGLQFFAHAPGFPGTLPAPKTEHHYMAQIGLVRGLREAGFVAKLEYAGAAPGGEMWRADVFCEAHGRKIAYEVQLSQQTLDEYERRADRYARSQVKCVWLVRSPTHYFAFRKAVILRYKLPVHGPNALRWPGVKHLAALPLDIGNKKVPAIDSMKVVAFGSSSVDQLSLAEFSTGVARGNLVFSKGEWRWR